MPNHDNSEVNSCRYEILFLVWVQNGNDLTPTSLQNGLSFFQETRGEFYLQDNLQDNLEVANLCAGSGFHAGFAKDGHHRAPVREG